MLFDPCSLKRTPIEFSFPCDLEAGNKRETFDYIEVSRLTVKDSLGNEGVSFLNAQAGVAYGAQLSNWDY